MGDDSGNGTVAGMTARLPIPVQVLALASMGALAGILCSELWIVARTSEQPLLWWIGRATGFVAYGALCLSMLFGMAVSSKGAGGLLPKRAMMDLHEQWTLSAVVATAVHVATIVGHAESGVTPWAVIIPFASARLTGAVALGTFALAGLGIVAGSSWLRTRMPYSTWRAIHALAFGTTLLALVHGWTAGSDSTTPIVAWLYVVTLASLIGALVVRLGLAQSSERAGTS